MSPLSCNSSVMSSLQILHLARLAEGVRLESSHDCLHVSYCVKLDETGVACTGYPPSWLIASSVGSREA